MNRALLVLCFVTLAAPAAFAQGGFNIFWGDCSPLGTTDATFACDANTGPPMTLFVSVRPGVELPQFVGADVLVDVLVNGPALPPWWQMGTGQCRDGAVNATADPNSYGLVQCDPIWGTQTPQSIFLVQSASVAWAFRMRFVAAIRESTPISAEMAQQELVVGALRILREKTTGADACAGCEIGACFSLYRVTLGQPAGVGDHVFASPDINSWVKLNGGIGPYHCEVPTQNRTWGAIKALYR